MKELKASKLKNCFDCDILDLKTIEKIDSYSEMIGQERASEALKFGLNIKTKGYNIFVMGLPGSGKTTFAEKYAKKIAETENTPCDLCYVYNFENPKVPTLLKFESGKGKEFKEKIDELIHVLTLEIPKVFSSDDYEKEKDKIVKDYQDKRDSIIKEMTEEAKEHEFGVKMTNTGMYFMPIIDGETISEEEFDSLNEEQKDEISERSEVIQEKATEVMRIIKEYERDTKKEIDEIEYNIGLLTLGHYLNAIQEKYINDKKVSKYLSDLKEDILENLNDFLEDESEEDEAVQLMIPWIAKKTTDEALSKYKINLLIDNADTKGAPVIVNYNPTYSNLIGEVEYDNEYGNFTTDFMKIKPGLLHKANGGYLILQVSDILGNPYAWETLRRFLKTNEIIIEPLKEYQLSGISISSIKPEALKSNVKVILVGTNYYYELLNEYDEDFSKLFKICSMFDYEMEYSNENIINIAKFIKGYNIKEKTLNFDISAINEVIEYSSRIAERQDKLTTRFNLLNEILAEANAWANIDNAEIISKKYIKKAIDNKIKRVNLYEEKYNEMILNNEIMIDTEGSKVGQINGLAVINTGTYEFGKPARITATTYLGKAGIVNIEKESDMSGSIHDKGVQVLSGYIGQTYAQDFPLTLSCRICFEQNYSGIDGDSASSTELYAILSNISELPISQEIAVTGSINQKGQIQPIGGVTYKIEGFFDICNKRGLTGAQGVIIPEQNVKDLVLKDDVINAVKEGKFHIYPINSIDEGIEILTGVSAGKKNSKGKYPQATVHGMVIKKLKEFYKKANNIE